MEVEVEAREEGAEFWNGSHESECGRSPGRLTTGSCSGRAGPPYRVASRNVSIRPDDRWVRLSIWARMSSARLVYVVDVTASIPTRSGLATVGVLKAPGHE